MECTKALTASLIDGKDLDANGYASNVKEARARTRKTKALRGLSTLKTLCNAEPKLVSRRMMRAKETGAWLNNLPNTLNDTVLAEEEFRDSLRLRFGLVDPLKLPSTCDGCGKKSTSTTPSSARREASSYTATTMSKRSGVRCVPAP